MNMWRFITLGAVEMCTWNNSVKSSGKSFLGPNSRWEMSIFWWRESHFKGNRTTLQTT
jgi:hypothetical protein